MKSCFFATDLHGRKDRYRKLFDRIATERPAALFLGGDLLPHQFKMPFKRERSRRNDFVDFLKKGFQKLKDDLKDLYPQIFLILGNDDMRIEEQAFVQGETEGYWHYVHEKKMAFGEYAVYGYAYVPPTPFGLKDWEKYDTGQFLEPNCISPEEGLRSVPVDKNSIKYSTIQKDLETLAINDNLQKSIFLFHSPPYRTNLDRAALDGIKVDHIQLDVHCGSIAIQRFIESRQPLLTLHGHIHESSRITGSWQESIGRTVCFSAAHDGPELGLVRFDLDRLDQATREHL